MPSPPPCVLAIRRRLPTTRGWAISPSSGHSSQPERSNAARLVPALGFDVDRQGRGRGEADVGGAGDAAQVLGGGGQGRKEPGGGRDTQGSDGRAEADFARG